ncbi:MAG: triose-phosphate isomerase [Saprospiraceae bacterium]
MLLLIVLMDTVRKAFVAANWKMNVLPSEALKLAKEIKDLTEFCKSEVLIAPSYTHFSFLTELIDERFQLGAQNVHSSLSGAHTGSISVKMLKDLSVDHVILGHSECRAANNRENEDIPIKINLCLNEGMKLIYCCGEPEEERLASSHFKFVETQLAHDFESIKKWPNDQIIIAYEPIWAIGTGLNATGEEAESMHLFIRNWIAQNYNNTNAEKTRIIYGGSVKAKNASELAGKSNIDGALVGGASLDAVEFSNIVKAWDN